MTLQPIDQTTLQRKGITAEKLEEELRMLKEGFPYLKIKAAATIGDGILGISDDDRQRYVGVSHKGWQGCEDGASKWRSKPHV